MRDLDDIKQRWRVMQTHDGTLAELQNAVKYNGDSSPCVTGLRSLCWKTFILSAKNPKSDWISSLRQERLEYTTLQAKLLKYIKHPEALAEVNVDPLADDPDSPWHTIRQDEVIRAEIRQDVQRLPDEVNYHEDRVQDMITDILFIYCRANPGRGGYRQGMHELLAPFVHVLETDAIDGTAIGSEHGLEHQLLDIVDSNFIEHDAYILFSALMDHAQMFYAVGEDDSSSSEAPTTRGQVQPQAASIVERSKFIHQVCLQKVDPELASHLTEMEVLPQIFLIRWVRLLFSREFPFEHFLLLWDTIFAVDPTLDLIDLICVAMLLRVRWQLLEADYSVCLQLLLKYPPPEQPHGPNTFVSDAIYLRGHLNASGGATLITKYSGKLPTTMPRSPESASRPSTPSFRSFQVFRQRAAEARRASLRTPPTFMNQQVGVEAIFQGAAKGARGMFERGEKLGINQAVRDAVGEIKRNVQGFNDSRSLSPRLHREGGEDLDAAAAMRALTALEQRNQQLANMLEETVNSLKEVSASHLDDKTKSLELIEIAAAKVQFVKIYLEDSTMEVPLPASTANDESQVPAADDSSDAVPSKDIPAASSQVLPPLSTLSLIDEASSLANDEKPKILVEEAQREETGIKEQPPIVKEGGELGDPLDPLGSPTQTQVQTLSRPKTIPRRSALAQSSFSWMLEPNETSSTQSREASKSPPVPGHKKGPSSSASREKNAFLFGEPSSGTDLSERLKSDDIFGMEPLRRTPSKS